jgi:hypothetical protein
MAWWNKGLHEAVQMMKKGTLMEEDVGRYGGLCGKQKDYYRSLVRISYGCTAFWSRFVEPESGQLWQEWKPLLRWWPSTSVVGHGPNREWMRRHCCTCQAARFVCQWLYGWVCRCTVNWQHNIRTVGNHLCTHSGLIILIRWERMAGREGMLRECLTKSDPVLLFEYTFDA